MSRGNPNQGRLVNEIRSLGYRVTVRRNQICVEDEEPMTIVEAKRFIYKRDRREQPSSSEDGTPHGPRASRGVGDTL